MSNFSAEAHYESKIKQGSIKNQSCVIRFDSSVFEPKRIVKEKGLRKICKDEFSYESFKEINKLHCEYLNKIKKSSVNNKGFLESLYKAELTGASIRIAKGSKDCFTEGFIVEERKNSLVVILKDNSIKIYPKIAFDFTIRFDEVNYKFLSKLLKKNRMF